MKVGSFGGVNFIVSSDTVETIRNFTMQQSASIQAHKRHLDVDLPEFTGTNLSTISFVLKLSKWLGPNLEKDMALLQGYLRSGVVHYFTLGGKVYGRYKWLISSLKIAVEDYDKNGRIVTANINVTLT